MIRNSRLTGNQVSAKDEQQIQECEKDMLKLYAYRAEVVRYSSLLCNSTGTMPRGAKDNDYPNTPSGKTQLTIPDLMPTMPILICISVYSDVAKWLRCSGVPNLVGSNRVIGTASHKPTANLAANP